MPAADASTCHLDVCRKAEFSLRWLPQWPPPEMLATRTLQVRSIWSRKYPQRLRWTLGRRAGARKQPGGRLVRQHSQRRRGLRAQTGQLPGGGGGGSPRRELPSPPGVMAGPTPAPRRFPEPCRVPGTEAGLVLPVCSGPQEAFASDPQGASGATWSDGCKAGSQGRWVGEEAGHVPSQSRRLQGELRCGLGDTPAQAGAENLFENKQTPVFLGTISKRTQI